MVPMERQDTLAMQWPDAGRMPRRTDLAPGYAFRADPDHAAFAAVQRAIGFEMTPAVWAPLNRTLVEGSMVLVESEDAGTPVAVAAAERRLGGWVELGWVAVAPDHRGRGLGLAVCTSLTRALLASGEARLIGSTQDHRLPALAIYFALGFHPVFRAEKVARWQAVCHALRIPYSPARWGDMWACAAR